ncbi:hypothetical protein AACH06_25415 [Ideonella sp. DXS29W]|uniref:Uncharacterized protein n=1 Tax=Ideonella lacteola TaxID=2984193 RepID=A0ABU9BW30_9BURK
MRQKGFDAADLFRLRSVSLQQALAALGLHFRKDAEFAPVKQAGTERWYVSVDGGVFELVVTGTKWFDPHEGRGGGGAIDLAMHLWRLDFVGAVKRLLSAGL